MSVRDATHIGFARRQPISSQNLFYNSNAMHMISYGVDWKLGFGVSETMFSSFRGTDNEYFDECTPEGIPAAYVVDSYKISLGSYIREPDDCLIDQYRVVVEICTFENYQGLEYRLFRTHAMVAMYTVPGQVVTYEGKLPVAVRLDVNQFFGVRVTCTRTQGHGNCVCVMNMESMVQKVDDGRFIFPRPYEKPSIQ